MRKAFLLLPFSYCDVFFWQPMPISKLLSFSCVSALLNSSLQWDWGPAKQISALPDVAHCPLWEAWLLPSWNVFKQLCVPSCNVHTIKPTTFPHRRGVVRPSCGIPATLCLLHGLVACKSCPRHTWCQEMIDFTGIRGLNEFKLMQCVSFNRSSSILRRIVENAATKGHPHIKKQAKL